MTCEGIMEITQTLVDNSAAPLGNFSITADVYLAAVEELTFILDDYGDSDDFLSKRLHRWGDKVVQPRKIYGSEEAICDHFKKRVRRLMHDILINPMDPETLSEPVLDGDWVWEKWILEDYMLKCKIVKGYIESPYDECEMEPTPHLFAQAMLVWAKTYKLDSIPQSQPQPVKRNQSGRRNLVRVRSNIPTRSLNREIMTFSDMSSRDAAIVLIGYYVLAREAIKQRAAYNEQESNKMLTKKAKQMTVDTIESLKEGEELSKKNERIREKRLKRGMQDLAAIHKSERNILSGRLAEEVRHAERLEEKVGQGVVRIIQLEVREKNLNAQVQQQAGIIAGLQNQSHGGGGMCTLF
jgi:hypothetical protein